MKVGILGGGQLARMLVMDGQKLGLDMHILCGSMTEPAAQVCPQVQIGALDSADVLGRFLSRLDLATLESEFLNTPIVQSALGKIPFLPDLNTLAICQDRLSQKQLLKKFKIPTADFTNWNGEPLAPLKERFKSGFVLKKRRYGYDGYGTFVFKKGAPEPRVPADTYGYIAEELIPFRRELAFSLARNADGEFAIFPLVETCQVNSRCLWVKGPIQHRGIAATLRQFKKLMNFTKYQGILAVELFEYKGKLLVNELAPRVHNSAHYSMDALDLSQFEAHWRGVLNWPLKNPERLCAGFAMVNLLGESSSPARLSREPLGRLHWYGKSENRAGRKMGHLNTFGKTPAEALKRALLWRKGFDL